MSSRDLAMNDCVGKCDWRRSGDAELDGEPLFACSGCGSEWVPSQSWTPKNADGEIAAAVRAAREG